MTVTSYLLDPPTITGRARDARTRLLMQECVDRIVDCLNRAGVPYCLLRNRDRIPGGLLGWTDLDLMISDTVSFRGVLNLFLDLNPATIAPIRRGFVVMFFPVGDRFLRVDVFNGSIEWRAAAYGLNQEILAGRRDDNGIMVATVVHQAFLAWFSRLLQHGNMPDRYVSQVTSTFRTHPAEFRKLLCRTFGDDDANQLVRFAAAGAPHLAKSIVPSLRKNLWLNALRRDPTATINNYLLQVWNAVDHRLRPAGLSVAIVGPSPIANAALCKRITTLPSRMVPYVIAEYIPRGDRRSVAHLWATEVIRTRQRLAHAKLVVRDHHPAAEYLTGATTRRRFSIVRARLVERISPGSDLVIILDSPEDTKPEPYPSRLHTPPPNRRADTQQYAKRLPNAVIVSGAQTPDAVLATVIGIIADVAASRTRARFSYLDWPPGLPYQRPSESHDAAPPIHLRIAWQDGQLDAGGRSS